MRSSLNCRPKLYELQFPKKKNGTKKYNTLCTQKSITRKKCSNLVSYDYVQ